MENIRLRNIVSAFIMIAMIGTIFALPIAQSDVYGATKYKVTFKANKGTFAKGAKKTKKVTKGKKMGKKPKVKRSGYAFMGWYTKKSGGKKYTKSTKINKKVTLYAHWTKKFKYNDKYTKYFGKTYNTASAAETALAADFGKVNMRASSINSDGDETWSYEFSGNRDVEIYKKNGTNYYVVNWIALKATDVVNTTKTYKYKTFMKKMGISKYEYLKNIKMICFEKNGAEWSIDFSKKGYVKKSDMIYISD